MFMVPFRALRGELPLDVPYARRALVAAIIAWIGLIPVVIGRSELLQIFSLLFEPPVGAFSFEFKTAEESRRYSVGVLGAVLAIVGGTYAHNFGELYRSVCYHLDIRYQAYVSLSGNGRSEAAYKQVAKLIGQFNLLVHQHPNAGPLHAEIAETSQRIQRAYDRFRRFGLMSN